jgi:hypothetical protein
MDQPTPLLRWGRGLLKLEMLRPRRSIEVRGPVALSGNQALAVARPGLEVALRGAVTHEMREGLKIWGVRFVSEGEPYVAPPDERLTAELSDLAAPFVAPAGDVAVLLQLRGRRVALVAADEELPDLRLLAGLPEGIERVAVSRAQAARARSRLARELGLLATHAGAAAGAYAFEHGGVAILCTPGEREFSLDP